MVHTAPRRHGRKTVKTIRKPAANEETIDQNTLVPPTAPDGRVSLTSPERQQLIAERAYSRAEQRGFEPGRELDDWLAAENEVNSVCSLMSRDPSQ